MTDKVQKIKQEIERRYNCEKCYPLDREANVAAAVLQELLLFIDSLPEEHNQSPVIMYGLSCSVGLEDAVKGRELYKEYQGDPERQEEFLDFAKFGNQYQEHNEDLEEEILCSWEDDSHTLWPKCPYSDFKNIARYFAEWQKKKDLEDSIKSDNTMPKKFYEKGRTDMREEMMKDAVEGEVVYKIGNAEIAQTDVRYKVMSDRVYIPNVKLGDKVKIIIIKTDQQ